MSSKLVHSPGNGWGWFGDWVGDRGAALGKVISAGATVVRSVTVDRLPFDRSMYQIFADPLDIDVDHSLLADPQFARPLQKH